MFTVVLLNVERILVPQRILIREEHKAHTMRFSTLEPWKTFMPVSQGAFHNVTMRSALCDSRLTLLSTDLSKMFFSPLFHNHILDKSAR